MPRTLNPCGTQAAYKRHKAHGEQACEPCNQARRDYDTNLRRTKGVKPVITYGVTSLIEDITFLLSCGEGEHAILKATGYIGRERTLRMRLNKHGRQDLTAQVFNTWELAA